VAIRDDTLSSDRVRDVRALPIFLTACSPVEGDDYAWLHYGVVAAVIGVAGAIFWFIVQRDKRQ